MRMHRVYDATLEGWHTEEEALDYARGIVWCEVETTKQEIPRSNLIETIDGVGVFFNYGSDYYFFTDETKEK
jgi:hypothetical protein